MKGEPYRKKPRHGDVVEKTIPARKTRQRYCGKCGQWCTEAGGLGSGVFRHRIICERFRDA